MLKTNQKTEITKVVETYNILKPRNKTPGHVGNRTCVFQWAHHAEGSPGQLEDYRGLVVTAPVGSWEPLAMKATLAGGNHGTFVQEGAERLPVCSNVR